MQKLVEQIKKRKAVGNKLPTVVNSPHKIIQSNDQFLLMINALVGKLPTLL